MVTYTPEQIARITQMNGSRCDACTQHVQIYEYRFTPALLTILGLIVDYVKTTGVNYFKASDLSFTRTQLFSALFY